MMDVINATQIIPYSPNITERTRPMNVTAVKSPNPIVVISVKQYHNAS